MSKVSHKERIKDSYDEWKAKALALKREIKILFIAESPPPNPENYIYFADGSYNKKEMTYHIFNALGFEQDPFNQLLNLLIFAQIHSPFFDYKMAIQLFYNF